MSLRSSLVPSVALTTLMLVFQNHHVVLAADEKIEDWPAWIRATSSFATIWYSPQKKIWVRNFKGHDITFSDDQNRVKYLISENGDSVAIWPLGEENPGPVFPKSQLTGENKYLGGWFFQMEQVVDQQRREVVVDGKTWIEIRIGLIGGGLSRATLRTDPRTTRPVYLLYDAIDERREPTRWDFDYPDDGPERFERFTGPGRIRIKNHRPSEACQNAMDVIALSRNLIGDFRLVVTTVGSTIEPPKVLYRKGDRWLVEYYQVPEDFWDEAKEVQTKEWGGWIDRQLKDCRPTRILVSNGNSVYDGRTISKNAGTTVWQLSEKISPLELMSKRGASRVPSNVRFARTFYPDLTPEPMEKFEFDPDPEDAPSCLLFKQSWEDTEQMVGHFWHYIDPAKGHAVVKYKSFRLARGIEPNAESIPERSMQMLEFRKSPQGWWYPAVIQDDERQAGPTEAAKTRYHFDFRAELPESLFAVDSGK